MPTCPNGHQSGSDDWCEVCGHRMAGPGASTGAGAPPAYGYPGPSGDPHATAQAELCPQCRTPREAMAPYCEECRYNFLTHTATSYTPIAPPPMPGAGGGLNLPSGFTTPPPGQQSHGPGRQGQGQGSDSPGGGFGPGRQPDSYDYQISRPSQLNRPAEPIGEGRGQQSHGFPPPPGQGRPFPQGPGQPGSHDQGHGGHGIPGQGGHQDPLHGYPSQHSAATAPPQHQQPQRSPQQGGVDDWMLSPPSQPHSQAPSHPQAPPQHAPQPQHGGHQGYQQQSDPFPPGPGRQNHGSTPGQHQSSPPSYHQAPVGWTAVIGPDREYFTAMMQRSGPDASGLTMPAYTPEQHLPLVGNQITIGRRRQSTGESPDVDLSVPPEDPGVSHKHAVLVQQPDGSWAVVDQKSTNGTTINGAEDPIQPYVPVPLNDGDRVHVGAWTTITIRRG
ncbi:FHA domain-containing protein [Streptomyces sp. CAU 1734]|uniref:FHA domain-containing protein n=1 Tax=Streptomyces sp. CAU 1734 TaxID=3140360 RepID=UPI003261C1A6